MTCNVRQVGWLAGALLLPVTVNAAQHWAFNGTDYDVTTEQGLVSVVASRQTAVSIRVMKALCRKGLGLPLRQQYEDQLLKQQVIQQRFTNWPMTNLTYGVSNLTFSAVSTNGASCAAVVKDTGYQTNLPTTALDYAVAYFATRQYQAIDGLLPLLMKSPAVSMDGAGLVTLLLARKSQQQAAEYFDHYVKRPYLRDNQIKFWLADWQFQQGRLKASLATAKVCRTEKCARLAMKIEDAIFAEEAKEAGDLSSYIN